MSEVARERWGYWTAAVLAILFLRPGLLYAVNPQTPLLQYGHTAWRLEDGLLSAPPTAITQTKDGYIWIGTNSDLLRFDGVRFTSWHDATGQPPVLGSVTSLLGASDGSLWIRTSVVLQHWDGRTLTDFRRDRPAGIPQIAEGDPGTVWVARVRQRDLENLPLCRVSSGKMQCFGASDGFVNTDARSVVRDEAGNIWTLGTQALTSYGRHGVTNYRLGALNKTQGLSSGWLRSDGHGGLWVGFYYSGHNLGLEHFQKGKFENLRLPNFNSENIAVSCMLTDTDDTVRRPLTSAYTRHLGRSFGFRDCVLHPCANTAVTSFHSSSSRGKQSFAARRLLRRRRVCTCFKGARICCTDAACRRPHVS